LRSIDAQALRAKFCQLLVGMDDVPVLAAKSTREFSEFFTSLLRVEGVAFAIIIEFLEITM